MRLSPHFTLQEFIKSQYAIRHGIDNTPPNQIIIDRLKALCENTLEPIRTYFNAPVVITSGYRSPVVNAAIGGAKTSQHVKGEAADIEIIGVGNTEAVRRIIVSEIKFDQMILEGGDEGWIHVSYRPSPMRREVLVAVFVDGKAEYSKFV